jgi:hypothetical protein
MYWLTWQEMRTHPLTFVIGASQPQEGPVGCRAPPQLTRTFLRAGRRVILAHCLARMGRNDEFSSGIGDARLDFRQDGDIIRVPQS